MTPRDADRPPAGAADQPAGGPGRAVFPRAVRLLRPTEFKRVYDLRQSGAAGPLVLYAAPNGLPDGRVRLGLSVSRRVGTAVVRNRWKRRLREAFRTVRHALPAGNDYVLVVRGGEPLAGAAGARRLAESLAGLAGRVTGRRGYGSAGEPSPPPPRRR